jgi:hypothetical protein
VAAQQAVASSIAGWVKTQVFHLYRGRLEMKYEKPAVQRFGSLRELTLGGGPQLAGDATNQFHRS